MALYKSKSNKAKTDGYYMIGTAKFKLRKDSRIPDNAEVFYYDSDNEREETVTPSDVRVKEINETIRQDGVITGAETVSDPFNETPEKPKGRGGRA